MFDLGHSFLASVERHPGALALVDGDVRLTYENWFQRITTVAGGLAALGLKKGDRLAVVMQNNWQMATLHWACQICGVIITPLNWRLKGDDLAVLLRDSAARGVAFDHSSAASVTSTAQALRLRRIAVDQDAHDAVSFDLLLDSKPLVTPQATADEVSLMLYTSGTTGPGKGVPRTHGAERAAAIAHIAQNRYGFGECALGVMPLYHTMGVRTLLSMALTNGVYICQPRFDSTTALRLIAQEHVTHLYLVPTLYHDLIEDPAFAESDITSVRKLGFAGASMTAGLMQKLQHTFRPDLFVNHYGSSEIYTFSISQDAADKPGAAGKAGLNQRLRVVALDRDDPNARVDPGTEGQIIAWLGSDEAFRGYWRRPDADAKALRHGWYFTGDIGYFDGEGDLFVTGRVDDMIITGGENVMPTEVEDVLSLHPAVAEVAVVGLPDPRWGNRVAAYIKPAAAVDQAALDSHCRASALADFKRPRQYVFVAALPRSPVGKLLRHKLLAGEATTLPPDWQTDFAEQRK